MSNHELIQEYWRNKILRWEQLRYSKYLFFYPASWTIRSRLSSVIKILSLRVSSDWTICELGCGSGILAEKINSLGKTYQGIDIADSAIELAKKRVVSKKTSFIQGDVTQMTLGRFDLFVFLGLTDWLEVDELEKLFRNLLTQNVLFTYTEKRAVPFWNPYKFYRMVIDNKTKGFNYKANSYSEMEIKLLVEKCGFKFEVLKKASILNPGVIAWAKK